MKSLLIDGHFLNFFFKDLGHIYGVGKFSSGRMWLHIKMSAIHVVTNVINLNTICGDCISIYLLLYVDFLCNFYVCMNVE